MGEEGWTFFMGEWRKVDIYFEWVGLGGDGWKYIMGGWGWVEIFYRWLRVGGSMFWLDRSKWTFLL